MQADTELWLNCPHCEGSGACTLEDGKSCGTCMAVARLKNDSKIVRCEVCEGVGKTEPKTVRLNARLPFFVALLVILVFYFYAFASLGNGDNFEQMFPLVGSLTTMIVTFYFSKKG